MDYFKYLSETYDDFKEMTKEEILTLIKQPSNTINLINDIKDFIFGHGYELNLNLILNYLLYIHNYSKEIDNILVNKILDYYKLEDYKHVFDNKKISFKGIEFKLIENGIDIKQIQFDNQIVIKGSYSTFFIPFLAQYIFNCLEKVIVIERENIYALVEKGIMSNNYNNFYVSNPTFDTNLFKNNILAKEPQLNMKYFTLNEHIKYFSLATPYQKEKYKTFHFDINVLHDYKNVLTKESLLSLIKDLQKYKNIVNEIITNNLQNHFIDTYSLNQSIVINSNIHQSYFKEQDSNKLKNYNITYQRLEYFFDKLYSNSTIFIHKNNKNIDTIILNEISNFNNILFIVFKINSPFYSLKLQTVIDIINNIFRDNISSNLNSFNVSNILFYINTICDFFKEINFLMSYDTLPLTDYSYLIFKIFLDLLFLNFEEHNFVYFENQFIIYGSRKHALETFNKILQIFKNININISNIQIYDKLFHDSVEVFDKKIPFTNIIKADLFKNIDIDIGNDHNLNIKKNIIIKKKSGLDDKESNLIINIDDPMSE